MLICFNIVNSLSVLSYCFGLLAVEMFSSVFISTMAFLEMQQYRRPKECDFSRLMG